MAHRISRRVAWRAVAGEVVIVDLESGRAIGLNPAASFTFPLLPHHGPDEIAARLVREFEVDETTARRDVELLVEDLTRRGLLEPAHPEGAAP